MKLLHLSGIKLALDENEEQLNQKAAAILAVSPKDIVNLTIIKKAIDARRNKPPHFVYAIKLIVADDLKLPGAFAEGIKLQELEDKLPGPFFAGISATKLPTVVVGSGPAGLFAAYVLSARGLPVLLLERGTPIEKRTKDVQAFWEKGILNSGSNVLFGEGGAGTFSDGKLTSRSKNPYSSWVKEVLVEMGAPAAILADAKPHIGTDLLKKVVVNLRHKLAAMGCTIRFEAQVTDFIIRQGSLTAIIVNEKEEIKTGQLVLAIGQSADDTYKKLWAIGVRMEAKPFAMGLRVEHPQELINSLQYGKWSGHPQLPPAEYFVTAAISALNRSVYTFCMCPGGEVIGCSAFPGYVLTNGMSNCLRNGNFANSAVVVNVRVDDFALQGEPLSGLEFRARWEKKAFEAGGGNYYAPTQRLTAFLEKKAADCVGPTSFRPGTKTVVLDDVLPAFVAGALKAGIHEFNRKMPGFITEEAHLIGVETRTSSPVRIPRKADGQSENVCGLYPCGEGSGYAGGIISSALDGIKAAENLIANLK
ncbi:MAG: NAD(P)/FAD-dependent oxidoreductase [Smithellaceae bacterium]